MTALGLGVVLLGALAILAASLNNTLARLGIVELALSQGYPSPGDAVQVREAPVPFDERSAGRILEPDSLHLFVSATCVACARLVDDLSDPELELPFALHIQFAERRSPLAKRGQVHQDQAELFARLAVPVTPYAVQTGPGIVTHHGGVADLHALAELIGWSVGNEAATGSPR